MTGRDTIGDAGSATTSHGKAARKQRCNGEPMQLFPPPQISFTDLQLWIVKTGLQSALVALYRLL